jgi:uncharacterized protein (TIGR03118 family)
MAYHWFRRAIILPLLTATVWGATIYTQTNLTSDIQGLAAHTDPNLKNPWGVSFSPVSPFWISDQGTNLSTLYDGFGVPNSLVVSTPPAGGLGPTGQVANTGSGFVLPNGGASLFIFATLSGTIDGWNGMSGTTATLVASTPGASYTGLAMGANASGNFLYAANFAGARIDAFNSAFAPATLAGTFTDPNLPAGFAPFNIENIGGNLFVEYAQVNPVTHIQATGAGLGFVSVFDTNGNFVRRLISQGSLNAPWGIAVAPASFGDFSNQLLVGNFGDGLINAFDPINGTFLGTLQDGNGNAIMNDRLWALKTRTGGPGVNTNAVYFTAGINNQADGLFGSIQVVPEPQALALVLVGLAGFVLYGRYGKRPLQERSR